ncbi:serine hydrolase [Alteriqipengyuania lutimaris]|uniref:beta-lactamase n=1 Tax=Alteriqipengyuania lutimaris TaxID=1538146 RepID=A0A395LG17_9SPHN|nr:serine hydrolase [Alteriqipengyuania lutimaris]MBB3035136.1 beta-lactamase class A [Alteriqipengyuania lutimaris]RDS75752.1 serine hydrolase [Alteriqipengyuania lutimaris]
MRNLLISLICPLALGSLASCNAPDAAGETSGAPTVEERIEQAAEDVVVERSAEEEWLDDRLFAIGSDFAGKVGIAVHDPARGRMMHFNGTDLYPQQSVSKLWVALTALDQADRGRLDLSETGTVRREDVAVFYSPIRGGVVANGSFSTSWRDFMKRAITASDNTANDMVLRRVGGPDAVRATLARKGFSDIRFGPGERPMQSAIAGLEWNQAYAFDDLFFEVRKSVPHDIRQAAFDDYVDDPVDGATPVAIAAALGELHEGALLSEAGTQQFLEWLGQVKSGPNRLKGGLPAGWSIGHKTGTGQVLDIVPPGAPADQAGYNDVGILTAPDGSVYTVAVLVGRTQVPIPARMEMMHAVVRAVAGYHEMVKGAGSAENAAAEGEAAS